MNGYNRRHERVRSDHLGVYLRGRMRVLVVSENLTRRQFIVVAGAAVLAPTFQVRGANRRINLGIIGCGGKGTGHARGFARIPDVRIAAVCDPDMKRMAACAEQLEYEVMQHQDYRHVLDNKDIDAVVIATPNHWHTPMALLACQAGKHVYVEKPVSHSIWETRQLILAARKYDRIVQAGTQHRSDPYLNEVAADLKAGKYGKVLWIHCSKLGSREPIGKCDGPLKIPDHIDYNLWAGPAPMTPVMRKQFHYDWHWQWDWGDGEMGNWAIHYLDDLFNLGIRPGMPRRMVAAGNRFVWDDDGQTPNMHLALFDWDGLPVVVDIRNLPDPKRPEGKRAGGKGGAVFMKRRGGNVIMCEGAEIRIARGGGKSFDRKTGDEIKHYPGTGGSGHDVNFIEALQSGDRNHLHAEVETAIYPTILCHLANIGVRLGADASAEKTHAALESCKAATDTLADMVEQIEGNGASLEDQSFVLGPQLEFDVETERFAGDHADAANAYLRTAYRQPFAAELPS